MVDFPFAYLVGVDGGGTSCRARICDLFGNILGEAKATAAPIFYWVVKLRWHQFNKRLPLPLNRPN